MHQLFRCKAVLQDFILELLRIAIIGDNPRFQRFQSDFLILSQNKTLIRYHSHAFVGDRPGRIHDHLAIRQFKDQIIVHVYQAAFRLPEQPSQFSEDFFRVYVRYGRAGNDAGRIAKFGKEPFQEIMFAGTGTAPFADNGFRIAGTCRI